VKRSPLLPFALAALWVAACASSPPSKPAPPEDPELDKLTEWLKLDASQKERTGQLLKDLYARNGEIREKWEKGAKMRTQELLVSRAIFERDFFALLTEDQRRIYADARLRIQMLGKRPPRPSS
jgi:hypothetical protein